jgi:hypothetical protein
MDVIFEAVVVRLLLVALKLNSISRNNVDEKRVQGSAH